MKKRQIIAACTVLVAGIIGFAGVYSSEKTKERQELEQQMAREAQNLAAEESEQASQESNELEPEAPVIKEQEPEPADQIELEQLLEDPSEVQLEVPTEVPSEVPSEVSSESEAEAVPTVTAQEQTLHFPAEDGLRWPLEGNVLLNYSMDSTIYFPTLDQYQCNPAIVIEGAVNTKVYVAATGTIMDISTNEVTGCTVTQDLGDGYSAVYGQLKEVTFQVGDTVKRGQVIGYVGEPTKYYSAEGSNLYFQLLKDGVPVNPLDYLE